MKIEVNISKTHFFVLLGIVLLLGGIFTVYAFGGNNPSIMGHSVGEIDWSGIVNNLRIRNINFSYGNYNDAVNPYEFTRLVSSQGDVGGLMHSRTGNYGTDSLALFTYGNRDIVFRPGGSGDSLFISGNVGIGTNAPTAKLNVNGNVLVTGKLDVAGKISVYQCPTVSSDIDCSASSCSGALSGSSTCAYYADIGSSLCVTTISPCTFVGYLFPT